MADVEQQKIAVELRKFRKKLRQIEKLEDLERELTDEEIFKLSKKDEVRSKVQQLVAREDELTSEMENIQSDSSHDEQALTEREEQPGSENTQDAHAQSSGNGPQEVANQNEQNESELTINDIYDQAPVLEPHPADAVPDVVSTVHTRAAPIVASNQTYMRFQVRNLQGHNDVICGVDSRGSVLVSGRGNYQVHGSVKRVRIEKTVCKRKCVVQHNQDQRTKKQRTDNEIISSARRQLQGECSKRETDVVKENVRMVVDQSQDRRSESSTRAKRQRMCNEMISSAHRQSRGDPRKGKAPLTRKNVTGMVIDQSQDQRSSSNSSVRRKKQKMDNAISSSEHHQLNAKSSNRINAVKAEISDDITAVVEPLSFNKSSHVLLKSEKKAALTSEPQQQKGVIGEGTAMSQNITADGMVLDHSQDQLLSSRRSSEAHVKCESKETFTSSHQQPQAVTVNQAAAVTENDVKGKLVDQSQDQLVHSSESGRVRLTSKSKIILSSQHEELQAETSNQTAAMTKDDVKEMLVHQSQDQLMRSSTTGQLHIFSERKEALPREHLQTQAETNNQPTKNVGEGIVPEPTLSLCKSDHVYLSLENKETSSSENQQPQTGTSNQTVAMTESVNFRGTDVDRSEHLNPVLSSSKSGQVHLTSESNETIPGEHQQQLEEANSQTGAVVESSKKDIVQKQVLASGSDRILPGDHQRLQPGTSNQGASTNEDQLESSSSSGQFCLTSESDNNFPTEALASDSDNILPSEHQQQLETSDQAAVMKGNDDEEMVKDQGEEQLRQFNLASESNHNFPSKGLASQSDHILSDEHQQLQAKTSNQAAVTKKNAGDVMVKDPGQDQLVYSSISGQFHLTSENNHNFPREVLASERDHILPSAQQQPETSEQEAATNKNASDIMVKDQSEVQLAQFDLASDSNHIFPSEHQQLQPETSNQVAAMIENADEVMVQNQGQHNLMSSSTSGQFHPTSESNCNFPGKALVSDSDNILPSSHQQQPETSNQAAAMNEKADDGMVKGEGQDQLVYSSASGELCLISENNHNFPSECQQVLLEASNQPAVIIKDGVKGMVVDQSQRQFRLASECKTILPSKCQPLQPDTGNQAGVTTEGVLEGMLVDEKQDPDPALISIKSVNVHLKSENTETFSAEHYEKQANTSNQGTSMTEQFDKMVTLKSLDQLVSPSTSGQGHLHSKSKSILPSKHQQQAKSGTKGALITERVDDGMGVAQSDYPIKSVQVHRKNKETFPNEYQRLEAKTSSQSAAMTENVDARMTYESSSPSGQVHLKSESKSILLSEDQQPKPESGNQMVATIEDVNVEGIVEGRDQCEGQCLTLKKSVQVFQETLPVELQHPQGGTSSHGAVITETVDDKMVVDECQILGPLSSSNSYQVHLTSESKQTLPIESQPPQAEANNQTAAMTDYDIVNVGGKVVDGSEDINPAQPSIESNQGHLSLENKETLLCKHKKILPEASNKTAAMIEDVSVGEMVKDYDQCGSQCLTLNKSVQVFQDTLPVEHQHPQGETNSHRAVITENVDFKMVVDESEDINPALSSIESNQGHPSSENKETLPSKHQQTQAETSNHTAKVTTNVSFGGVGVDQGQNLGAWLSSSKPGQVSVSYEVKVTLQAQTSSQTAEVRETDEEAGIDIEQSEDQFLFSNKGALSGQDLDERLPSRKSSHVDLKIETKGSLQSEHQHVLATASKHSAAINEYIDDKLAEDRTQDQLPSSSSKAGYVYVDSLPGKHEKPQAATAVSTEHIDGGMVGDVYQDLDKSLSSNQNQDPNPSEFAIQIGLTSGNCAPAVKHQETQTGCSLKRVAIAETAEDGMLVDQSEGLLVSSSNSGQIHFTSNNKETSPSAHRQLQATSNQTAAMTDNTVNGIVVDQSQVPRPSSSCSSQSELTHLKTEMWKKLKFSTRILKGHTDLVYGVDCRNSVLVSGGRDTMLKLWDADTGREMRSMGGHTGTITSVLLVPNKDMSSSAVPTSFRTDQYSVLTGSRDCSMKLWSLANGQIKRSMYAFSPVECLDCNSNNLIAAGLDGGKVELWDLESGTTVSSVRGHDEDAVTAVKFHDDRVISGSATGVVKVWDIRDNSLKPALSSDQAPVDNAVKPRRVRCLATTQDTAYWGDDGVNIKAMDLKSGKIRKIRNHITDFGTTGAMATTGSCLVSAGYDLDRGNGYLNVRSVPYEEYLATVDDECTGSITCLACTQITCDKVTLHRMCTGGLELKLWDQLPSSKIKKRSRPETDDVYVTAKHLRRYSLPDISDTESSEDDDDQPEGDDSDDDDDVSNTGSASRSWCTIS